MPADQARAPANAVQTARSIGLALAAAEVDPLDAANQLLDFGESAYPEFFPSRRSTRHFDGYLYRHYPERGTYLGVRDGQVYVLGGPLGEQVLQVGALADFINPLPALAGRLCAQSASAYLFYTSPAPAMGRNVTAAVLGCNGAIASLRWQQIAGPSVSLLSDKTQAISFDATAPGPYSFRVSFVDASNTARSEVLNLRVAAGEAPATRLTVRASHAVRMGGKVSVRAWPSLPAGDAVESITWTQLDGPAVTLDTRERQLAVFTAPEVEQDTLLRLRATLRSRLGAVEHDEVSVLVARHAQAPASDKYALWGGEHVPRVYPYKPAGRYAADLVPCVYDSRMKDWGPDYNLCSLRRLPFLAQQSGEETPTVEQVMDRVLVSHDWLGRNFEALLREHDTRGDFRRMLRSVTAVVLSTQVRPSNYYAGTGAIYLDADDFWLTAEEKDTVNEVPDYRSEFGNALQFTTLWRYVRDNQRLLPYRDPALREPRPLQALLDEAGWLLYHELTHALDFLPPQDYDSLRLQVSAWGFMSQRWNDRRLPSDQANALYPLRSQEFVALGEVLFRGAKASDAQQALSAQQAAELFRTDLATDDYNYATTREDLAMTVEEFLMQQRQGARRDMAFSERYGPQATGSTINVTWGQRGRIGEPEIRGRLREFLRHTVPWVDLAEVDGLPPPQALRAGASWTANLNPDPLAAPAGRARLLGAPPSDAEMAQFRKEVRRMRHHQHPGAKGLPRAGAPSAPAR